MAGKSISSADLAAFLLQPIPRTIPANIIAAGKERVSRAWVFYLLGGFCLLSGSFILSFMLPIHGLSELRLQIGPTATATALLIKSEDTGIKLGEVKVHRFYYRFTTDSGAVFNGRCYASAALPPTSEVIYLKANPRISRYEGTRLDTMGNWVLLLLIFPILGVLLIAYAWRSNQDLRELLRDGVLEFGTIISILATEKRADDKIVYEITVMFTVNSEPRAISYQAHGNNANLAIQRYMEDEKVGVLYALEDVIRRILIVDVLLIA